MRRAGCATGDHPGIGRRKLLQVGALSLLGTSLADLLRLESQAVAGVPRLGKAKSVVFIFQSGGPSQHETFDPKPLAPAEIRGEYGTTQTSLPGVRFCEYLPRLAARANRFSVVRTMHHIAGREFRNEHNSCTWLLQTGTTELPAGDTNASIVNPRPGRFEWPSIGSLLAHKVPPAAGCGLPAVLELPRANGMKYPGRGPGMLGPRYARWGVDLAPACKAPDAAGSCPNCFSHDDPNDPARAAGKGPKAWWDNSTCRNAEYRLPDLGGVDLDWPQIQSRTAIMERFDSQTRALDQAERSGRLLAWDAARRQAMELLVTMKSGKSNPFDLGQEPARIRDLYGREDWGNGFLVARRLVEGGARMVQVNLRGWDTHQNAFRDLKKHLLPSLDHCLSGFLDDLGQRGLLDETLVVMCGEMGRTPRISPITPGGRNASGEIFTPGRHHWGDVFPCFFAGGGIRPGMIVGETDKQGGLPVSEAYTPADLAATIFHLMGVGPRAEFHDLEGRPYRLTQGEAIAQLLA